MSHSNLVTHVKLSPNCTSPRTQKIDTVTIHMVVGQASVESLGELFANPERQASSNYGIGSDGRIACFVEEEDRSWCTGSRENDHRAITIEVASDTKPPYAVNEKAFAALLDLLEDICRRHDLRLNYTGDKTGNMTLHKWFQATECPGQFLEERHSAIAAEVNRRLDQSSSAPSDDACHCEGACTCGNPSSADDQPTLYRVQAGAFRDRKNAIAHVAKLKAAGFDAFIQPN